MIAAVADGERAEQHDQRHGQVGDQLEERPEPRAQPHALQLRVAERPGGAPEPRAQQRRRARRPCDADAGGRLFGERGEVALLVLHPPRDVARSRRSNRRRARPPAPCVGRDQQAERPVQVQQQDEDGDELQRC